MNIFKFYYAQSSNPRLESKDIGWNKIKIKSMKITSFQQKYCVIYNQRPFLTINKKICYKNNVDNNFTCPAISSDQVGSWFATG